MSNAQAKKHIHRLKKGKKEIIYIGKLGLVGGMEVKQTEQTLKTTQEWLQEGNALFAIAQYKEAIECYSKAIQLNPNYANAYYNKGLALYNIGQTEAAIEYYDSVLKLQPNYAQAHYNKGLALTSLGKHMESVFCYDKAIKLYPNYADAYYNKGLAWSFLKKHEASHVTMQS
jgi:tetratricopeptide (TPR) repeat protein